MKPLLSNVESVLFDLDGTLVETNIDFPLMKREMMRLAVDAGISAEDIQGLDILGVTDSAVRFLKDQGKSQDARRLRSEAMRILEEIEFRHANETQEIPFARELVSHFRDCGIAIGIVTRNCRPASELSLRIADIQADVLICREDSANHKPHPEPVLLALARLNADPRNSVMVGDHIMDVQGGKAAGTKTIGFLRPTRADDFFDSVAPDFVTRDLREVLCAIIDCRS
jgi:HAD superfamily hydrolase (TIGR01509 family)